VVSDAGKQKGRYRERGGYMSIAVYPRLGDVLDAKNVTVPELKRRIEERFHLSVELETLYSLSLDDEPIRHVDIRVAEAVAAVLDVPLDDLFGLSNGADPFEEEEPILDARDSQRMTDLFDRQGRTRLSKAERKELAELVSKYQRILHERRIREIATMRGISVEQANHESQQRVKEVLEWWSDVNATPERRAAVIEEALQRRERKAG